MTLFFGEEYGYYVELNHTLGVLDTAMYEVVNDATVILLEGNTTIATFEPLSDDGNGYIASDIFLLPQKEYTLRATSPVYGIVEATQQLPTKVMIIDATYEANGAVDRYGERGDEVTIQFKDLAEEKNYYQNKYIGNFSF